ncbi:hypothetical protein NQD34_013219 [Periophthalmus magnuspinnatus]|nr:hypothetical protein NQD34_013219 [Periophthalmus magnuspinnatus]
MFPPPKRLTEYEPPIITTREVENSLPGHHSAATESPVGCDELVWILYPASHVSPASIDLCDSSNMAPWVPLVLSGTHGVTMMSLSTMDKTTASIVSSPLIPSGSIH